MSEPVMITEVAVGRTMVDRRVEMEAEGSCQYDSVGYDRGRPSGTFVHAVFSSRTSE